MKFSFFVLCGVVSISLSAFSKPSPEEVKFYRDLTLKIRKEAVFKVPMVGGYQEFDYRLEMGSPVFPEPTISDVSLKPGKFYRNFWDRIFVTDGSRIVLNGEEIPLTCIFISGQDNRFSGNLDPRFPEFILKIYLVANDYTCTGPLNPGWPGNGGKKEMWDTYIHYEVRDPTIMLPAEIMIRYRWNEFQAVLVK